MLRISFAVTAALVAGFAFANPQAGAIVGAGAAGLAAVSAEQQQDVAGTYALSNGRVVRLTTVDDRLYIDLNDYQRSELLAAGPNVYATRDGAVRVTIKPQENGNQILVDHDAKLKARVGELPSNPARVRGDL